MEVIYGLILYVSICCWLCWLLMRVITLSFWLYWLDIWWGRFIDWWRRLCYRLLRLSNLEILILLYKKIKLLTKYFMQDIQLLIIRVQYVCWNFRIIINVLLCQVVALLEPSISGVTWQVRKALVTSVKRFIGQPHHFNFDWKSDVRQQSHFGIHSNKRLNQGILT
jgi:hypothetical protein